VTNATSTAPRDDLIGRIVAGKYRVTARVARGGMAWIFRAEQLPLGRVVALKLLTPPGDERSRSLEERFLREAATCARLRHPNTVTVHDYGAQEDGTFYMVMEFVEGRTLAQEIRTRGTLEPVRAVRIVMEILRSLQEAHSAGVVHRDLKPSNVMLVDTAEGESIKVLDFGIAKVLEEAETDHITADSHFVGSPGYMSPEQIARKPVDGRADLYAIGVVLFEMLTGKPPFKGKTPVQTLMSHLKEDPPPLDKLCPHPLPDSLVQLVLRCLAKEPVDRPPSAADLRRRLREVLHDLGADLDVETPAPADPSYRTVPMLGPVPGRRRRGSRTLLLLVGVALMTLLGLLVMLPMAVLTAWLAVMLPVSPQQPAPPSLSAVPELVVRLRSDPPGAVAQEAGRMLGATPVDLRFSSAQAAPRHITLSLPGHQTIVLQVSPGEHDREQIVKLEATPSPPPPSPEAPAGR
jgi:serine/threonine protein kinase